MIIYIPNGVVIMLLFTVSYLKFIWAYRFIFAESWERFIPSLGDNNIESFLYTLMVYFNSTDKDLLFPAIRIK